MRRKIIAFLKNPSSLNIFVNTVGNYLNIAFTAFFVLFLVRILSPANYGVLSVLLGIAYVLANVLDFGVTATIYSYLPRLLEDKREKVYQFIKTTFLFQLTLSTIVIAVLFITFPYLDKVFFKTRAPILELYITTISVLFLIWQNFILNILFAAKKFLKANIYNNIQNVIKTVILFVLIYLNKITVGSVLFVFGIVGPLVFFLLIFLERRDLFFILAKASIKRDDIKFNYTFTYFFATQLFNLGGRMDLFLLSYYGLRNEVGEYGLAQKIILTIETTVISITQVIAPNFAKIQSKSDALKEIKHGFLYLLLPTSLFVALVLTPQKIFDLFFTEKFSASAWLAKGLVPAFLIFTLGALPLQFILYTVKKPIYVLYGNLIYFISMTIGCYYFIPQMGVRAPLFANFIAILAPVSILGFIMWREYKRLPGK